jgi:hypothetical protein
MQAKPLRTAGICMLDFSLDLHVKNKFPTVIAVYKVKKPTFLGTVPIILPNSP